MENVADSGTPSLTCKTITRPCKKFQNGRTVQNVNNGQSGRPCSAACDKTVMTVTGLHIICKAIHVAVRLVSLKPAFNTFCSTRSGNRTYSDGLVQWMMMIQNAEWNIMRVLTCVCAGRESFLDLFGLMKPLLNLMVLAQLYVLGHQKSCHNRRTSS